MPPEQCSVTAEYEFNVQTLWGIEQVGILFRAIHILATDSPATTAELARIGAHIADHFHNEIDLRNEALKNFHRPQPGVSDDLGK